MAYNKELTQRVRELLAGLPKVEEKKMFGSIGFMVNDKLCIGVGDYNQYAMMVRVGKEKYDEALKRSGAAPMIMRGREYKGYISLVAEAVESQKDLEYWVNLALDYNKSL